MKKPPYGEHGMKTYSHFVDSVPANAIIGAVAVYPSDDENGKREVSALSRDLADRFIERVKGESLADALFRALARRLTAKTGGETAQNLNMLDMLYRIHTGEFKASAPLLFEGWWG